MENKFVFTNWQTLVIYKTIHEIEFLKSIGKLETDFTDDEFKFMADLQSEMSNCIQKRKRLDGTTK